jgi:hypothetical protein
MQHAVLSGGEADPAPIDAGIAGRIYDPAVSALCGVALRDPDGDDVGLCSEDAREIVAAIRAGRVHGLCAKPVDDPPPPATTEWRPCPDCGSDVLWRVGGALGDHQIQHHKCDELGPVNLNDEEPDKLTKATPPADDAAVDRMADAILACDGCVSDEACRVAAEEYAKAIVAAIRRGEVPGIWCGELAENIASAQLVADLRAQLDEANYWRHNYADSVKAVQAEMKAEVERLTRERDDAAHKENRAMMAWEGAHDAQNGAEAQRDQLKARVEELEAKLDYANRERDNLTRERNNFKDSNDTAIRQRDEARADLAVLKRQRDG